MPNASAEEIPVVAVLLAAGSSRRLGQPKQLLNWLGQPLWLHTLEQLLQSGCDQVVVVLGAYADQCRASYDSSPIARQRTCSVVIGHHQAWEQGQASSLHFGLQLAHLSVDQPCHVLVALCDQPLLNASHYRLLIEAVRGRQFNVAATRYPEGGGVPACIDHHCLRTLRLAPGDVGVKAWIRHQPASEVALYDFDLATSDVDTVEQWSHLTRQFPNADVKCAVMGP